MTAPTRRIVRGVARASLPTIALSDECREMVAALVEDVDLGFVAFESASKHARRPNVTQTDHLLYCVS